MAFPKQLSISYDQFFALSERQRWKLETDLDWDNIDRRLLSDEEVEVLRQSALVESFTPGYGADLLATYADDVNMSSFLTIQIYEEFKHFHALRRYLRCIGIELSDADILEHRAERVTYDDFLVPILKFGVSEIFTAIAYRELSRRTREPVLQKLARLISMDEYRHLRWYTSYLQAYVEENNISAEQVNQALEQYQHQGLDAIGDAWIRHWRFMGQEYTGLEPYIYLRKMLRRIVGRSVNLRSLAERTSDRDVARTYH